MFKITSKSKYGGIWDGSRIVRELETDDAHTADALKADGCEVEEFATSLDKLNVAQLKKYAKDNGIDLGEATTKDAILAAIGAAAEK